MNYSGYIKDAAYQSIITLTSKRKRRVLKFKFRDLLPLKYTAKYQLGLHKHEQSIFLHATIFLLPHFLFKRLLNKLI